MRGQTLSADTVPLLASSLARPLVPALTRKPPPPHKGKGTRRAETRRHPLPWKETECGQGSAPRFVAPGNKTKLAGSVVLMYQNQKERKFPPPHKRRHGEIQTRSRAQDASTGATPPSTPPPLRDEARSLTSARINERAWEETGTYLWARNGPKFGLQVCMEYSQPTSQNAAS
ncbi:hypothetical protein B0H14DRAFT_2619474 [Mycena olivaceomarginata]|nr:hypothetical protein B0H14DRAFT_2619474 [Mycena olivaceomarginata]